MANRSDENPGNSEPVATLHDNTMSAKDDRRARGQALRTAVPFKLHAGWSVPPERADPIELLKRADTGRVPELIPIRYGRMLHSAFTFCRGSALVMAADLIHTPSTGVKVQTCGDCHALNFGAFATPERNVVFDINDFDETLPGPWEWDLKRLAVSLVLIARDNAFKAKVAAEAAAAVTQAYVCKMEELSRKPILDIWYDRIDWEHVIAEAPDEALKKSLKDDLKKAQKRTAQARYFPKMTHREDGRLVITDNPPLIYHVKNDPDFAERMKKGFMLYRESLQEDKQRLLDRYQICDVAMKVVGIGSVGTTCAVALMTAPDDEPLFLQIKEARASVLEPYVGASGFANHGQRVVAGQRIMQSASDILLGWMKLDNGKHFYVRQLRDTKVKLVPEEWGADHLIGMSEVMGKVLARAHARSGDSAVIAGYLGDSGEFERAIADFALSYADQMEKDHSALVAAVNSGRIKAEIA